MNKISVVKNEKFAAITPKFVELRNYDWIFYGEDNLFPNKLIDLANKSALNNAIIMSKIDNVCGNGFMTDDLDPKTLAFVEHPNPNESLDQLFRKIVYDYVIFGGFCLNVIWSRDRKSIAEIYHVDFSKLRSGKANYNGRVYTYWYSKNWAQYRKKEFEPQGIAAFDTEKRDASQLLYVMQYRPGVEYYPLPSYMGALGYIEIDTEISNFHLSHIKNGMTPGMMITFNNGIPTDEEQSIIEQKIKNRYEGTDNAGKFILNFADDQTKAPTVTTLTPAQLDKQFIQLQDTVLQNILSGHQVVSPLLVGIPTPGSLSNASEMLNAFQLYNSTVINPLKEVLLGTLDKICAINGLQDLEIATAAPIEFSFSENIMAQILSHNELREKIGYEPVEVAPVTQKKFFSPKYITVDSDLSKLKEKDLDNYYIWVEDDEDACPACKTWAEKGPMKLRDWFNTALPGIPNGENFGVATTNYETEPFGTYCEGGCRCRLVKITQGTENIK